MQTNPKRSTNAEFPSQNIQTVVLTMKLAMNNAPVLVILACLLCGSSAFQQLQLQQQQAMFIGPTQSRMTRENRITTSLMMMMMPKRKKTDIIMNSNAINKNDAAFRRVTELAVGRRWLGHPLRASESSSDDDTEATEESESDAESDSESSEKKNGDDDFEEVEAELVVDDTTGSIADETPPKDVLLAAYSNSKTLYATAAMILLLGVKGGGGLRATKIGGAAGFALAGALSAVLEEATTHDRLGSDTYKCLNIGLLAFCTFGLFALPAEIGLIPIGKVTKTTALVFTSIVKLFGGYAALTGWKAGVEDGTNLRKDLEEGIDKSLKVIGSNSKETAGGRAYSRLVLAMGGCTAIRAIQFVSSILVSAVPSLGVGSPGQGNVIVNCRCRCWYWCWCCFLSVLPIATKETLALIQRHSSWNSVSVPSFIMCPPPPREKPRSLQVRYTFQR